MDHVIETEQLRKVYRTRRGARVAVAGLDLAVPAGGVHGFLGPNGSGKTTTIRMLLGLASATGGSMQVLGHRTPRHLPEVIDRIGAVVESPKFSPTFSARRNLQLLARSRSLPSQRVDSALATVGLTDRAKDTYRSYSLGMKQRLAIAATLLKQPELLILDEPTNGLDPAGIHEIRETIRSLGDNGVTVLLSSHILAEVQQVCDAVTIIGRGRMLASGPVAELVAGGTATQRVDVAEPERAIDVLTAAGLIATRQGEHLQVECAEPELITRTLAAADLWVRELSPIRADLESVYLGLTQGEALSGDASGLVAGWSGTGGAA